MSKSVNTSYPEDHPIYCTETFLLKSDAIKFQRQCRKNGWMTRYEFCNPSSPEHKVHLFYKSSVSNRKQLIQDVVLVTQEIEDARACILKGWKSYLGEPIHYYINQRLAALRDLNSQLYPVTK